MKLKPIEKSKWLDAEWGNPISCEALPYSNSWPYDKGTCVPNRNPWEAICDFRVTYENGKKVRLFARGWEILSGYGFRGCLEGEKSVSGTRYFPLTLVGLVVQALADCSIVPGGAVDLPSKEAALASLKDNGVPDYPAEHSDEEEGRLRNKWYKEWNARGVCIDQTGGMGRCVSKKLIEEADDRFRRGLKV
jgi:hypothetical protein